MDPRRAIALRYLEFHAWATQKTLDSVQGLSEEQLRRNLGNSHGGIWGALEHTYQADTIWLKRLQGVPTAKLDEVSAADLPALRTQWADTQGRLIAWAGTLSDSDWGGVIDYRFMSGAPGRTPIFDNVLHVVNHGTYHRGQVVTMLRQLGAEPVATDFVHYVRTMTSY